MGLIVFFRLLRTGQWYKNLLIFLPILFSGNLFSIEGIILTFVGFFSLCFVSSSNYIINDILDIRKDQQHSEKKRRPLASGKIKIWQAVIVFSVVFAIGISLAGFLNEYFFLCALALFVLTSAYSFILKKEAFLDIIIIGINFVIRASSGAFIINVKISPWLIIGVFFLSLFLSASKRRADLSFLGKKAKEHKSSLRGYSNEITNALMIIATTLLILSYTFYSFLSEHSYLIFTLPFALYLIFRYFALVYSGSVIARRPEKVFSDLRMIIGMLSWITVTLIILYLL
ncbi:UbiA prenyltransferase family protein [Candidatus Woesearchaeota archaeon]|nr:UbiA prenyltransferase family protein [Candidatus Woesearchaeota archaeon]